MSDNIELEIKISGNETELIALLGEMAFAAKNRSWDSIVFNTPFRSSWGKWGTLTVQSSIKHPDDRPLDAAELRAIRRLLKGS